jgi:hypothetical protein
VPFEQISPSESSRTYLSATSRFPSLVQNSAESARHGDVDREEVNPAEAFASADRSQQFAADALGGDMFAHALFRARIDDAEPQAADVHDEAGSNVTSRCRPSTWIRRSTMR